MNFLETILFILFSFVSAVYGVIFVIYGIIYFFAMLVWWILISIVKISYRIVVKICHFFKKSVKIGKKRVRTDNKTDIVR